MSQGDRSHKFGSYILLHSHVRGDRTQGQYRLLQALLNSIELHKMLIVRCQEMLVIRLVDSIPSVSNSGKDFRGEGIVSIRIDTITLFFIVEAPWSSLPTGTDQSITSDATSVSLVYRAIVRGTVVLILRLYPTTRGCKVGKLLSRSRRGEPDNAAKNQRFPRRPSRTDGLRVIPRRSIRRSLIPEDSNLMDRCEIEHQCLSSP
jgi:hypothetical protein